MKRTGEILKKEREARGLSLHEIGLSLKINSKILKAIEEGDSTRLPAKTFLRGFVQSYAGYLKLNVEEVLKVFADEMGTTRPQVPIKEGPQEGSKEAAPSLTIVPTSVPHNSKKSEDAPKKQEKTSLEESSTTKGLILSLIGVLLAGFILITMKVIERYQREAQVTAVDVKPIEEDKAPLPGKLIPEATVATPATEVPTTPVIAEATPAPLPIETATPKPPSIISTMPKEVLPEKAPVAPPLVAKLPPPPPVKPPEVLKKPEIEKPPVAPVKEAPPKEVVKETEEKKIKPIELIVEALDTVEIEYATGAGKVEKIKLEPEQIHTFKSKAGLKLTINNGGAVNMILNGKDLGVPGDLGKSIKLNY